MRKCIINCYTKKIPTKGSALRKGSSRSSQRIKKATANLLGGLISIMVPIKGKAVDRHEH